MEHVSFLSMVKLQQDGNGRRHDAGKRGKRILIILICAVALCAVAFVAAPRTAHATPATSVQIHGVTLDAAAPYYANGVNGTQGTTSATLRVTDSANPQETATITIDVGAVIPVAPTPVVIDPTAATEKTSLAKTGDSTEFMLWVSLLLIVGAGIVAALALRSRKAR